MTNDKQADILVRVLCWAVASAILAVVARPFHLVASQGFEDALFRTAFGLIAGLVLGLSFEMAALGLQRRRQRARA